MTPRTKMFLIISEEDDYGYVIYGRDPTSAVEGHYAEMDAYCAPQDPELNEEFALSAYEIPEHAEEAVEAAVENLSVGHFLAAMNDLKARFPDITSTTINVVYTYADGATASELKPMPDLFERLR